MAKGQFRNTTEYGIDKNGRIYGHKKMHEAYMDGTLLSEDEMGIIETIILNDDATERIWEDLTTKHLERLQSAGAHRDQPPLRLVRPED